MKLRHIISYSLQLFLPEKVMSAFERRAPPVPFASTHPVLSADDGHAALTDSVGKSRSRLLIEELDGAKFGGPSFGEESISAMAKALDQAIACLPSPVAQSRMKEIAQKILDRAADGERNSDHLRQAALDHFAMQSPPKQGTLTPMDFPGGQVSPPDRQTRVSLPASGDKGAD
jgi:hypothetical protein